MAEIKPICGVDDRVNLSSVVPLKTPFTLNIFPTNSCNFRCNYCAQSLGASNLKERYNFLPETMSVDTLKIAVEQAKAFSEKFKLVSMMGHGEPLVNPNLSKMINIVKMASIADRIDVITNASLLTKEKGIELIESGLDVIRISLQGLSSKKYRDISNVDINFDEFIDNISYFHKNKKNCKVFVKVMDISLLEGEEEKFYKTFENISDRMYIERVKPVYDGVLYNENVTEVNTDRYGNVHEKRHVCPQPFYMLSLWPNGDVAPCDGIYKANTLGNIHNENMLNMWNSKSLKKFCIMQLKNDRYRHDACNKCCAPDDVSHESDILDPHRDKILKTFMEEEKKYGEKGNQ
jgi:radical SAM protein with 4Fe4S-binding SPASM domain